MVQATKKKAPLVPKLRFKEFAGDGEWEAVNLGSFANIITEKAGMNKFTLMSITAGVGLVSQIEKFGREIAGDQYKNYFVIKNNDFAYSKSATKEYPEGFIALYEGENAVAVPNSIFTCFCIDKHIVFPFFLKFQFLNNVHGKWLRKFITIGARAHGSLAVDNKDLLQLPLPLPIGKKTILEQQRIADCLTSLDENITAESQKLEALTAHKKALMQKLFPAEGEKVPPLRFKEFAEDEEWEEKRLGSQVHIYSGDSPAQHKLNCSEGCPYIKVEDMNNCGKYQECSRNYVKSCQKAFPKFSVIFPKRGAAILNNKIRIVVKSFYIDTNMMALFPKNTCEFLSEFLYYLLTINKLSKIADTSSIPQINNKHIEPYVVHIPIQLEQQRIADCITSIDEYITAQGRKIALLKEHKKGLMQQLFPCMEEENV